MDLSIVIPAFNEQVVIEKSIEETLRFFSSQPLTWELIVVNDGSTDATGKILTVLQERDTRVQVITFPKNRGKGAAVREGFARSTGDFMLFFDADLSTPLSEFPKFWQKRNEHTVLIGSRVAAGASILHHQHIMKEWAGRASNIAVRTLLSLPFHDTQCGFKVYPAAFRAALSVAHIDGAAFDMEWLVIARRNNFMVQEFPITWANRTESRFGLFSYPRTLAELFRIMMRDKIRNAYAWYPPSYTPPMRREEYHHMRAVEADHFWFRAKAQFLKITLARCHIPPQARILDVGCGTGQTLKNLHAWGYTHAQGIDTSTEAVQLCRAAHLPVQAYEGDTLPFPSGSFDLMVSLDVLEHVPHDDALVAEFARVLAPGGHCVVMVPAHPFLWSYHDEAMGHYRRYARSPLTALFRRAGLSVMATSPLHAMPLLAIYLFRTFKSLFSSHPSSDTFALRFIAPFHALLFYLLYIPELIVFRLCGKLPFGNSWLLIARKDERQ